MPNWFHKIFGGSKKSSLVPTDKSPGGVYSGLRNHIFSIRRSEVGIPTEAPQNPIWGMVMESDNHGFTVTLAALSDGTTSLYFSNGGGIVGGQGHQSVRLANAAFLKIANHFYQNFKPTKSVPVPGAGHAFFYALTDMGILTANALENDLGHGKHIMAPLFYAAHDVITQLRLTTHPQNPSS